MHVGKIPFPHGYHTGCPYGTHMVSMGSRWGIWGPYAVCTVVPIRAPSGHAGSMWVPCGPWIIEPICGLDIPSGTYLGLNMYHLGPTWVAYGLPIRYPCGKYGLQMGHLGPICHLHRGPHPGPIWARGFHVGFMWAVDHRAHMWPRYTIWDLSGPKCTIWDPDGISFIHSSGPYMGVLYVGYMWAV